MNHGLADGHVPDDRVRDAHQSLLDALDGAEQPDPAASLLAFATVFAQRSAQERLAARIWFPLHELAVLQVFVNATATVVPNGDSARDSTRARALDGARILDHDVNRARDVGFTRSLDHLLDLDLALNRVLNRAADLDHALDRVLAMGQGLALNRTGDRVREVDLDLNYALDLANALARDLDRDLCRALDQVVRIARALVLDPITALSGELTFCLANNDPERAKIVVAQLVVEVALTLNTVHHRGVQLSLNAVLAASLDDPHLGAVVFATADALADAILVFGKALTDVTGADLSEADLSGVSLTGVLWSSWTRWPPDLAEVVHELSELIGPDLWRVVDGPVNRVGLAV